MISLSDLLDKIWKHVKRGSTYRVLGIAKVQTGKPLHDNDEIVVYVSQEDGHMWARPVHEFTDGRFVEHDKKPVGEIATIVKKLVDMRRKLEHAIHTIKKET